MEITKMFDNRSLAIAVLIIGTCIMCTCGAYASFTNIQTTPGSQTSGSSLINTEWQLVFYNNGNTQVPVETGSKITLKLENDGNMSGSGGINSYFGPYTQIGTTITTGPLISTLMAGPEPLMDQEITYFQLLGSVSSFNIQGSTLELSDASGHTLLIFRAVDQGNTSGSAGKDPVTLLPRTEWQLSSYSEGDTVVSGQDVNTITLKFVDAGNFSGFGGVNSYFGSYTLVGNAISIGPVGSTKMAGPENLMALESEYFSLLGSVTGVSLTGDSLSLTDKDGNVLLTFESKNSNSLGRYTSLLSTSHTMVKPVKEQSSISINGRFHTLNNWSGSAVGYKIKPVQAGKDTVSISSMGFIQSFSTMPRYNNSIIVPVTYKGEPLY